MATSTTEESMEDRDTQSVRLGLDVLAKVRRLADKERRTLRAQIEHMLEGWLAKVKGG